MRKRFKEDLGLRGREADTRIRDIDMHALRFVRQAHSDLTGFGELDGVADHVHQDLPHALRVGDNDVAALRQPIEGKTQPLPLRLWLQNGQYVGDGAPHRDRMRVEIELAGLDLGEIEQLVDEVEEPPAVRQNPLLELVASGRRDVLQTEGAPPFPGWRSAVCGISWLTLRKNTVFARFASCAQSASEQAHTLGLAGRTYTRVRASRSHALTRSAGMPILAMLPSRASDVDLPRPSRRDRVERGPRHPDARRAALRAWNPAGRAPRAAARAPRRRGHRVERLRARPHDRREHSPCYRRSARVLAGISRERSFGALRGRPYAECPIDIFAQGFAPPGGETWDEFHARVERAWQRVVARAGETRGNLAVVSHGLVCASIVQRLVGLGDRGPPPAWPNASLTILSSQPPHAIELLACTQHLADLGAGPHGGAA